MAKHAWLTGEFVTEPLPLSPNAQWSAVRTFRKASRAKLLARRRRLRFRDRERHGDSVTAQLLATSDLAACAVLGFYWPIRAEPDLRNLARRYVRDGGIAALPVVVEKNAPLEF
jgi:5-formyltetrahydrofolate cyclo-ligase